MAQETPASEELKDEGTGSPLASSNEEEGGAKPAESPEDKGTEVADDPGQLEGLSDDQRKKEVEAKKAGKNTPPEGSKRWNEVYFKLKESERRLKEFEGKLGEKDETLEALRAHNEELAKTFKEFQTNQATAEVKGQEKELTSKITDLTRQRDSAYDEGDYKKAAQISDEMYDYREKLAVMRNAPAPSKEEKKAPPAVPGGQPDEIDKAVGAFIKETPWFNSKNEKYDPVMAGAAQAIDAQLHKDPEWRAKPVVDVLREVKKRVEERFKWNETPEAGKKPPAEPMFPSVGGVDGAGEGAPAGKGTVTLTADQRRVAQMMFPNESDAEIRYAEQLSFIQKRG